METQDDLTQTNARFAAALSRGDAREVSSLYANAARLLAPSTRVIEGREAIEHFWRAGMDVGVSAAEFESVETHLHDRFAYEIGRYRIRVKHDGGGARVETGRYLRIHERDGTGDWKRAVEMFSPDSAPGLPLTKGEEPCGSHVRAASSE